MRKSGIIALLVIVALLAQGSVAMAKGKGQQKDVGHGRKAIVVNFADTQDCTWALNCITKMKAKRVINGYPDGTFRPNQAVSRLEAIVMAVRMMGLEDEAKEQNIDASELNFKDANLIEQKYKWAEGYLAVALTEGLFDATEDRLQPDKPATRLWAACLLVRALGLEDEALAQMTDIPDFKDAKQIPAGSIGYVNVALEEGLITGYDDNTFKPNKPVTRAEFAALLDRTDDDWDDIFARTTVKGEIERLDFDSDEDEEGRITIETQAGKDCTYTIDAELAVAYDGDYIEANELVIGDIVRLVVKDDEVIEATLVDAVDAEEDGYNGVTELAINLVADNSVTFELTYQNEVRSVVAQVERENSNNKIRYTGEQAIHYVEDLLDRMDLTSSMSKARIVEEVLDVLGVDEDDVEELKIEVEFADGEDVSIDMDEEDFDD